MRLLECSSDGGLTPTEDRPENEDLEYAILSHTWGSEEATFRDLVDGTGDDKTGYEKIRLCTAQAVRDDLRNFWVDICCIDKSNQVELSEAIISMFQWYRKAAHRYVYLSAPLGTGILGTGISSQQMVHRGWRLQELLAPASVELFAREGQRLEDKKSLEQMIQEITGIASSALRGTELSQFDVDKRIEWVKSRRTIRGEDWAYCLLGIFGVSMPPPYGEGKRMLFRGSEGKSTVLSSFSTNSVPPRARAFDSHTEAAAPTCHRDTRIDLLRQIREWADQPDE
ncbi:heterokaryon incompatibility protein-domain-containing protein [Podospora didyma]|uniref:Heterokaryon incompatibility protein-domain-containing protein n=1 Tax=Podospora didyma TaxID=330526 RepID=A0AAE0N6N5_9PEZI|nr:heterokaryon incompatibility protein-domain-containing protein [Podospora didyma]